MNFVDYTVANQSDRSNPIGLGTRLANALTRIRYQLLLGLLTAVILPMLVRGRFEQWPDAISNYDNSFFGTSAAFLIGYMIFRKVSALPGASSFTNIIPAFLTSYGTIMVLFFALRLQYSRAQFAASFVLVTVCFLLIAYILSQHRRARFVLVTQRPLSEFRRIRGVDWIRAPTVDIAAQYQHLPLVIDFHGSSLDAEWERYVAEEAITGRLVYDRRQVIESLEGRVTINHLSENSFGHLAPDSLYAPAKRYVDVIFGGLALVVLAPLMLTVAAVIRGTSPGPALFKQTRMGYRGKPFTVYKFRSMRVPEKSSDEMHADMTLSDDERITGIGRFIRRTRIDELPQIFNILRGDMSWIGPRPETLNLSKWYEREITFYRYRHIVRPGISGWAQVNQGHVTSVTDVREKLEYDFYYVKHFSLWTDVLIVIKTIGVMVTGHGSK